MNKEESRFEKPTKAKLRKRSKIEYTEVISQFRMHQRKHDKD